MHFHLACFTAFVHHRFLERWCFSGLQIPPDLGFTKTCRNKYNRRVFFYFQPLMFTVLIFEDGYRTAFLLISAILIIYLFQIFSINIKLNKKPISPDCTQWGYTKCTVFKTTHSWVFLHNYFISNWLFNWLYSVLWIRISGPVPHFFFFS